MSNGQRERIREDSAYERRIFDTLMEFIPLTKKPHDLERLAFSKILDDVSSMDYVFEWTRAEMELLPDTNGKVERVLVTEQGFYFIATNITVNAMVAAGAVNTGDPGKIRVYDNVNGFSIFNKPLNIQAFGISEIANIAMPRGVSDPYEIPDYYFGERGQIAVAVSEISQFPANAIALRVLVSGIKISTKFFKD